jgi:UDP-N-acetylmuramoylalanine--D-glutamate ligase
LGFGIVGKSALRFFSAYFQNSVISVWDKRQLLSSERELIALHKAIYSTTSLSHFLLTQDKIFISPGVFLEQYSKHILCELDLFSQYFAKQVIAITGTLGKTTVTKLVSQVLSEMHVKNMCGGNIGVGMLDMILKQNDIDIAVLELSSFQLERSKVFRPHIAVITNFFPNHLDRHKTMQDYFDAKCNVCLYQTEDDFAIIPGELLRLQDSFLCQIKRVKAKLCIVSKDIKTTLHDVKRLGMRPYALFYVKDNVLCVSLYPCESDRKVFDFSLLPDVSFEDNWMIVFSILYVLGKEVQSLKQILFNASEHRLEKCAVINGIDFYNDSKSTIMEATYAALQKIHCFGRPIILLLGGLNKGIDRTDTEKRLQAFTHLKNVFCFGTQVSDFHAFPSYPSLECALDAIIHIARSGDIVLFSPGGASFDLFDNYMHRGKVFKDLVWKLQKTN